MLRFSFCLNLTILLVHSMRFLQRIQYAKTKSDIIAKADGTFVPREKRKKHDDRGIIMHKH